MQQTTLFDIIREPIKVTKPMLRYRTIGVELNMRRSTEDFERKEDMHSMWKRV